MISKVITKEKDLKKSEEKKQRKRIHNFLTLLRDAHSMKEGVVWEEVITKYITTSNKNKYINKKIKQPCANK